MTYSEKSAAAHAKQAERNLETQVMRQAKAETGKEISRAEARRRIDGERSDIAKEKDREEFKKNVLEALHDAEPSWKSDGKGLRGDAAQSPVESTPYQAKATVTLIQEPTRIGGEGGASEANPFQVLILSNPADATQQMVGVYYYSDLWKNLSGKQTITGLLSASPAWGDGGLFACPEVGDLIWLSIGVTSKDDITADAAAIEHGSPWDGHPNPIILTTEDGITYQTDYNQIIAECVATTDPRPGITVGTGVDAVKIVQHLKTSLICSQWVVDGRVCLVTEAKTL
tara:strand:+ start:18012 stop:18866 length:855 start_codon:yes stop_codon:yes gene_type:complete